MTQRTQPHGTGLTVDGVPPVVFKPLLARLPEDQPVAQNGNGDDDQPMPCPNCGGTGEIGSERHGARQCPMCDGTGQI